ncbi:hypothetical protein GQ55_3G125700 [Panicum hallii var. hallii]|uniref:Uncharacterized protein n=1 Tax=Panicum hallii var. hallii TaxID=1504633 RepID=A0A2T7E8R0_9POAL|nr:hypothetical protein GQ55_3G125700 [Panicum hallii var. hallii]
MMQLFRNQRGICFSPTFFSPNFEISIFISTKIKVNEKEKKKQFPQPEKGKEKGETSRGDRRASQVVVAGATRGVVGSRAPRSRLTREAGRNLPTRSGRRVVVVAAAAAVPPAPPETNTSCLIFHARGTTRHGRRIRTPLRRAPTVRDREGGFGSLWLRVESGCLGPVLAPAPLAGRIPRCVPRQHFVSVCKLC